MRLCDPRTSTFSGLPSDADRWYSRQYINREGCRRVAGHDETPYEPSADGWRHRDGHHPAYLAEVLAACTIGDAAAAERRRNAVIGTHERMLVDAVHAGRADTAERLAYELGDAACPLGYPQIAARIHVATDAVRVYDRERGWLPRPMRAIPVGSKGTTLFRAWSPRQIDEWHASRPIAGRTPNDS